MSQRQEKKLEIKKNKNMNRINVFKRTLIPFIFKCVLKTISPQISNTVQKHAPFPPSPGHLNLVSFSWKRQKLVQATNGVETQVIDGKVEIENGNVPEDKPTEAEENDTISPFHIPSVWIAFLQINTMFQVKYDVPPWEFCSLDQNLKMS